MQTIGMCLASSDNGTYESCMIFISSLLMSETRFGMPSRSGEVIFQGCFDENQF